MKKKIGYLKNRPIVIDEEGNGNSVTNKEIYAELYNDKVTLFERGNDGSFKAIINSKEGVLEEKINSKDYTFYNFIKLNSDISPFMNFTDVLIKYAAKHGFQTASELADIPTLRGNYISLSIEANLEQIKIGRLDESFNDTCFALNDCSMSFYLVDSGFERYEEYEIKNDEEFKEAFKEYIISKEDFLNLLK